MNLDYLAELLDAKGFSSPNPPQKKAVELGLGKTNENFLIVAPTGSGKSFLGELAIFRALCLGKKAVWTVPLRALASQIREDLGFLEKQGFKISSSTDTDYDNPNEEHAQADAIVATNEKMDAWLRSKPPWIASIGTIVCDEVHEIRDENRGTTIDFLLSRVRAMPQEQRPQIIALSATIGNPKKFAKWLGAKALESNWRATRLHEATVFPEGTFARIEPEAEGFPKKLKLQQGKSENSAAIFSIAKHVESEGEQTLVFTSTRKRAESLAREYAELCEPAGNSANGEEGAWEYFFSRKTAFHHAGLASEDRAKIEGAFKKGAVSCLFATTTLAAGMNLPAKAVVVADTFLGARESLSVSKYKQMCGRAGRPKYHEAGFAFIACKGMRFASEMYSKYALGTPEDLESPFNEHELNSLLLAIVQSVSNNEEEVQKFVQSTFFAECFGDREKIRALATQGLQWLEKEKLAEKKNGGLFATRFGSLASKLLVRPETAVLLRDETAREKNRHAFYFSICKSLEMRLTVSENTRLSPSHREELERAGAKLADGRELDGAEASFAAGEQSGKAALILERWSRGVPIAVICGEFGEMPGNIERVALAAKWIAHAAEALIANAGEEQTQWCREAKTGIPIDAEFLRTKNLVGRETISQVLHAISISKGALWSKEDLLGLNEADFERLAGISKKRAQALAQKSGGKSPSKKKDAAQKTLFD